AVPQSPAYYGSVDATPLFLILLSEYVRWSGDLALARELAPNVEAALGWMAHAIDDGDGYMVYRGRYPNGLVNQGWKDSGNAIVNADGSLPEPPIALCEVQAYAFRAWRQTAVVRRALGDAAGAAALPRVPPARALLRLSAQRRRERAGALPGGLQPAGVGGRRAAARALEPARPARRHASRRVARHPAPAAEGRDRAVGRRPCRGQRARGPAIPPRCRRRRRRRGKPRARRGDQGRSD